ncbi:MAG: P-loop NTPase, partial [Pseudomonadales bacterium]
MAAAPGACIGGNKKRHYALSGRAIINAQIDKFQLDNIQHVIAVASGKGGVGKSTVSVNLAVALAAGGAPPSRSRSRLSSAHRWSQRCCSPGSRHRCPRWL